QRPGGLHSCAVEAGGGAVWCWGWGAAWRRDADANSSASPVQVAGIQDAVDVACGYQHTCAMDRYGAATCWGEAVRCLGRPARAPDPARPLPSYPPPPPSS
ncbi:unnamed protein product, partial [Prorocentrum cordatum]